MRKFNFYYQVRFCQPNAHQYACKLLENVGYQVKSCDEEKYYIIHSTRNKETNGRKEEFVVCVIHVETMDGNVPNVDLDALKNRLKYILGQEVSFFEERLKV